MSITVLKDVFKKKNHWVDNSPGVGYAKGQLSDEEYHYSLAINDPLWRYIVLHYPKESYGKNRATVSVLNYNSIAIAIELSQWGYDVTFVAKDSQELEKAKKDCEIQAGVLDKKFIFDIKNNAPRATITTFIGIIEAIQTDRQLFDYLDMLLRRSEELVFAVSDDRNWHELLRDRYEVKILKYPQAPAVLITLKEKEE